MDKITIINGNEGDEIVSVNGRVFRFPVADLLPDSSIWAVQWYGDGGEVERLGEQPETIDSLDAFADVLAEFERLASEEDSQPTSSEEDRVTTLANSVQAHLDETAKSYGYDNIVNAITYADEPAVSKFQTEGAAFREWRSLVWESCYAMLAQWEAGEIVEPTETELINQLPAFSLA